MWLFAEMCVNLHPKFKMRQQMKRYFRLLSVAFAVVMLCSSCLKGNDSDIVVYHDTAITSFQLGTLKVQKHTKSSTGADSVYWVDKDCSEVKFHIDPTQHRIFNTDSLPVGVNLSRVPCTINTLNSGRLWVTDGEGNAPEAFASGDTIDFSDPVRLRVYGYNSTNFVDYNIALNVHKQEGDTFEWKQMPALTETAYAAFLKSQVGDATSNGGVLVGRSTKELYARTPDKLLTVSRDGGTTWDYELLDDYPSYIPTEDYAYVCFPYSNYTDIDYVLIGGGVAEDQPDADRTHFWYKIVDYSDTGEISGWSYIEVADNNYLYLPRLAGLSLMWYDKKILAIGLKGQELKIYESKDGGITWKICSNVSAPQDLTSSETIIKAFVDEENFIWLMQDETGKVWRGRHNRLGWQQKD